MMIMMMMMVTMIINDGAQAKLITKIDSQTGKSQSFKMSFGTNKIMDSVNLHELFFLVIEFLVCATKSILRLPLTWHINYICGVALKNVM